MIKHPIRLGLSPLSDRVYAFRRFREEGPGVIVALGEREDITTEFRKIMNEHIRRWTDDGTIILRDAVAAQVMNEFLGLNTARAALAGPAEEER